MTKVNQGPWLKLSQKSIPPKLDGCFTEQKTNKSKPGLLTEGKKNGFEGNLTNNSYYNRHEDRGCGSVVDCP